MVIDNQSLFLLINHYAGKNQFLDAFAMILGEGMPFLFIAIEIYLYFVMKKKQEAIYAVYSVLLALLINQIIGLFYFHNRPFTDHLGTLITYHLSDSSFPSDHTTFMLAIAWSLFLSKSTKKLGLFLVIVGAMGGSFRIFIGVHYPFDIAGGIVVGFISAIMIYSIKDKFNRINKYIEPSEKPKEFT